MLRTGTRFCAAFAFAAGAAFFAAGCGGDDDPAGPGPDPEPESGDISTFAGTGIPGLSPDGLPPTQTALYTPQDITFGPNGTAYIIDFNNHRVRTVQGGVVATVIGTGEIGDAPEGQANQIRLNHPTNVVFDSQGRLLLAAWHNSKVMRLDFSTGMLTGFAGDGSRAFGGDNGPAITAKLDLPVGLAFDHATGDTYICDEANVRIRKVDSAGVITTICGNGTRGYSGDGGPATAAQLNLPAGQSAPSVGRIAFANGTLYIADYLNHCVRAIDTSTGIITTLAGNGTAGYSGDGGPGTAAQLFSPSDVDVDVDGNVYVADTYNSVIRRVDTAGTITTFAGVQHAFTGDGSVHYGGDNGPATAALLDRPHGIGFDAAGNLYIADTYNTRVRKVWK